MNNANLYATLYQHFKASLDSDCLVTPAGDSWSYAELDSWSARLANALASLGATPGDRVLIQVRKSPANVALYLACLRGGFVLVPLNSAYTPAELGYFIDDAGPSVVVCDPQMQATTAALLPPTAQLLTLGGAEHCLLKLAESCTDEAAICPREPGDLAAMVYTSGTTGRSKGAMLSHGNLSSNAIALHSTWGFEPGDVLLHALPIFHVHGLFIALNTAMLNGSRIILLDKFEVGTVLDCLPQATVMMGVPTFYSRLLAAPAFDEHHFAHMRLFICGSAPLTEQTFEQFEQRTGKRILERYGMTETGIISSNPLVGERVAGTVGFALPGVEIRVAGDSGEAAQDGEVGTIQVRGPNVFGGYWQMPDKTAEEFCDDGWFITGDLGQLDGEGRLSIVGRGKDLIISGGFNVYPREVELCLDDTVEILESAVIGVPHPDFGEAVIAVCVLSPAADSVDTAAVEERLAAVLDARLASFKRPKQLVFVDELPRNAMGKVQKNHLRDHHSALFMDSEQRGKTEP